MDEPKSRRASSKRPRLALIAAGAVLALAALLVAAPFLIPVSAYRGEIESAASQALGRKVAIAGPLRATIWPVLGVRIAGVSIANTPGGHAPRFADIGAIDVGLAPARLLAGAIEVQRLIVTDAKIALEDRVDGPPNWVFPAQPNANADGGASADAGPLKELSLRNVRFVNSEISFRDKAGVVTPISELTADAAMADLDSPLKIDGAFVFKKERVQGSMIAARPREFLKPAGAVPLRLALKAAPIDLAFDGVMDTATAAFAGKVRAKGASLRSFLAWTAEPLAPGGGLGAFSVDGDARVAGDVTTLARAQFALDAITGAGDLAITSPAGKVPTVTGDITLASLDVNPYLAPPSAAAASAGGAQPSAAPKGVDVSAPWGRDRVDLSGFKAMDARLTIKTGPLLFQKMKIDRSAFDLDVRGGVARATLHSLSFYGGAGDGLLVLDGSRREARIACVLNAVDIDGASFLADAVGYRKLSGKAKLKLDITGAGETQQALMRSLAGAADFAFANGALKGVNLAQVSRQIKAALTGQALGDSAQTDFSALGASFKIANGIATTADGRMASPFLRVAFAGDVDIAGQALRMKVIPTLVKSAEGEGGAADLKGLAVPFRVDGPWAKVSFTADIGDAAKAAVNQQLEKVLEKNKGLQGLEALLNRRK